MRFHDYRPIFEAFDLPNVNLFEEQVASFKELLEKATPGASQTNDIDFLMAVGELFTLVVYAQLLLENARIYAVEDELVDQTFDVLVRDFSRYALQLYSKPTSTPEQMDFCLQMIRKPAVDEVRTGRVWKEHVLALDGAYEMSP